jgi:type IV pilus assembly protein PilQ
MDSRVSAGFLWRAPLLLVAALVLGACATEMAEVQPAPAAPQVAAPVPATPAAPEPPRPVEAPPPPVAPPLPAVAPVPATPTPAPPAAPVTSLPIEVTGIEVQEAGPGGLIVVVAADGPIATYESFTLPDPPRLVLDIPNATHAVPQPISARPPVVTAIRSSQYRERPVKVVRVVLDLRSMLPYRVGTADSQLRVQLGTAVGATPPSSATAGPTPVSGASGKVTRVDVQSVRGRQRIVIGTTGRVTYKVTEVSDPPSLLVDILGARIDPANARTLDLRQVTSPLNRLQASQQTTDPESVVRVVAELRSPARYEVRQTASAILVELLGSAPRLAAPVAPSASPSAPPLPAPTLAAAASTSSAAAPVPPTAAPPAAGRLSMDFKDADINNLLRIIAEVSGRNVVAGSDVTGKVTVRLVNVEWEQALDVILKINNMGYEIDGNIIRVAPLAKLEAERRGREDARTAAARARETEKRVQIQVEPLVTKVVSVNYAKASDVLKNLDRLKTPGRADASIVVDDRTNSLIIQETGDTIAKMETLLRRLDVATPQVLIEARIVEAFRGFSQSLGVEYGFANAGQIKGGQITRGPVSIFSSLPGTDLTPPTTTVPLSVSFPAAGASTSGLGIIFGSLEGGSILGIRLTAAESEQKIKTLSTPRVATMDNQEAEIRQGTQVPYTTVDSSGRTVVAFQDAFIRLKVTPHITNDRRISMKVEAEKTAPGSRIDYAGGFAFPLEQRKATTNVLVSNGSTIVIGGLFQATDQESEARLPWLHKIPLLGMMFKSHSIGPNSKTELLIFLTPTILEEPRLS